MNIKSVIFIYCIATMCSLQLFSGKFYNEVYLKSKKEQYNIQEKSRENKVNAAKHMTKSHYSSLQDKENTRVFNLAIKTAKKRVDFILQESSVKCDTMFIYLYRGLGYGDKPIFIRLYNFTLDTRGDKRINSGVVIVNIQLKDAEYYDQEISMWKPFVLANGKPQYLEYTFSYLNTDSSIQLKNEHRDYTATTLKTIPATNSFCLNIRKGDHY